MSVTENDIYNFFGLWSTKYLQETWKIDLSCAKKSGKYKDYAFFNVPDHGYHGYSE